MNLSKQSVDKELIFYNKYDINDITMNLSECNVDKELFSEANAKENILHLFSLKRTI
jgi:hypothetical protein